MHYKVLDHRIVYWKNPCWVSATGTESGHWIAVVVSAREIFFVSYSAVCNLKLFILLHFK